MFFVLPFSSPHGEQRWTYSDTCSHVRAEERSAFGISGLLREIAGQSVVTPGGLIVLSRETKSHIPVIPLNWRPERRLSYGDAIILVFQAQ